MYLRPRTLRPDDVLDGFTSRSEEQTGWLRDHARQAHAARTAHTMVVTPAGSSEVVAYYAWAMASVAFADVPARAARGAGRHPQPFALLARLAVDIDHERRGLGHALLADVVLRTVEVSMRIGYRGLLVHAEDDAARAFYLRALPGFISSPSDPMHLVALVKDLRRAVER
ncbi:GNAT family N-acetyltransferase [Demequina pelophila]|uniref:GNAT family N-acetyltransferase n=1 Tax=Demequina pelophila TaxID=1638984 RepID=UPI000AE17FD6|nr:GNAT family N-acetyltransferase [Demequina pelophila]